MAGRFHPGTEHFFAELRKRHFSIEIETDVWEEFEGASSAQV
jgi:hypothetical protein